MNLPHSSCNFSFKDLYIAAFGHEPETHELQSLYALPQSERNEQVKHWAGLAGWVTEDVVGSDGIVYTSFGPSIAE